MNGSVKITVILEKVCLSEQEATHFVGSVFAENHSGTYESEEPGKTDRFEELPNESVELLSYTPKDVERVWGATRATACKKILSEAADRPQGYPVADLAEKLGKEDGKQIGRELGPLGRTAKRLDLPPINQRGGIYEKRYPGGKCILVIRKEIAEEIMRLAVLDGIK